MAIVDPVVHNLVELRTLRSQNNARISSARAKAAVSAAVNRQTQKCSRNGPQAVRTEMHAFASLLRREDSVPHYQAKALPIYLAGSQSLIDDGLCGFVQSRLLSTAPLVPLDAVKKRAPSKWFVSILPRLTWQGSWHLTIE
uniref:Uncharacterized protein n=1 Tax=Peronospora matthiolae TaxID=2874970 RepID=A0AAV1VM49_9STRA